MGGGAGVGGNCPSMVLEFILFLSFYFVRHLRGQSCTLMNTSTHIMIILPQSGQIFFFYPESLAFYVINVLLYTPYIS